MTTSFVRTAGQSGALFDMNGEISNGVTWDELIYFFENGSPKDLTGLSFQLQFRTLESDITTLVALTTVDGDLVISTDDSGVSSVLRINVPYTSISALEGTYVADLVSKDSVNKLTHWGHGLVVFKPDPVAF